MHACGPARYAKGRGRPGDPVRVVLQTFNGLGKVVFKPRERGYVGNPLMVFPYSVVVGMLWHVEGSPVAIWKLKGAMRSVVRSSRG